VAVAGKVDRERRSTQRKHHCVPGVCVLSSTVDEDDLSGLIPPRQQTKQPTVIKSNRSAFHLWKLRYVKPAFSDVLFEQSELVVRS
jgi:hypothetical protein